MGTRPLYSALNSESLEAGIQALAAEFVFNLQQAVVFSNAFTAVRSAGFDLCRIQGHCEVCNGRIFRFTGTVGNDSAVAGTVSQFNSFQGFRNGADLVQFNEDRVTAALSNTFGQTFRIGNE